MLIRYTSGGQNREILFPLPPDQDYISQFEPKESVVESIDGSRQVTHHATVTMLPQKFSMLPRGFVTGDLQNFFTGHALRGGKFEYHLDPENPTDLALWELEKRVYKPVKNENTIDRYDLEFTIRRV